MGQDEERRKYQAQGGRKQKMSPQSTRERTILLAKPGNRRCQGEALKVYFCGEFWKQQETKSIKHSWLAQSHASLPTTTRALTSTLRTRKLHCQMQQNWQNLTIEHKHYLAASHWAKMKKKISGSKRKETKNVSATSESTYKNVSGARESKMPGGSSVSSLEPRSLEGNKKWNQSNIQGWLDLLPHCPPPPELWFQLSALESCIAKCNKTSQAHL